MASHVRITAAPSFCERRLCYDRRRESESQDNQKGLQIGLMGREFMNVEEANESEIVYV